MDITEFRTKIDEVDDEIVRLFVKRMEICAEIADFKKEHGLPINVPSREQQKLQDVSEKAGVDMEAYIRLLYGKVMELSRDYQITRILQSSTRQENI